MRKFALKLDLDNFGHRKVKCAAAHRYGYVETARSDCEHTYAAARRRMAIRAEQRISRHTETLEVDLMADSVAGFTHINAVL